MRLWFLFYSSASKGRLGTCTMISEKCSLHNYHDNSKVIIITITRQPISLLISGPEWASPFGQTDFSLCFHKLAFVFIQISIFSISAYCTMSKKLLQAICIALQLCFYQTNTNHRVQKLQLLCPFLPKEISTWLLKYIQTCQPGILIWALHGWALQCPFYGSLFPLSNTASNIYQMLQHSVKLVNPTYWAILFHYCVTVQYIVIIEKLKHTDVQKRKKSQ